MDKLNKAEACPHVREQFEQPQPPSSSLQLDLQYHPDPSCQHQNKIQVRSGNKVMTYQSGRPRRQPQHQQLRPRRVPYSRRRRKTRPCIVAADRKSETVSEPAPTPPNRSQWKSWRTGLGLDTASTSQGKCASAAELSGQCLGYLREMPYELRGCTAVTGSRRIGGGGQATTADTLEPGRKAQGKRKHVEVPIRERGCQNPRKRGCTIPGERGCHTPGERGCQSPGERGCESPGERGCQDPGERGCQNPGDRGCQNPGDRGCQNPGDRGCKNPGERGCMNPGDRGCKNPGERGCMNPGERGCKNLGEMGCQNPGKRCCQSPGKGCCQSPGKGCRQSPGKGCRQSPGKRGCQSPRGKCCQNPRGKGCQNPGESSCESPEQSGCETPENRGCQNPAENGCESSGESGCENGCDTPRERGCQNPGESDCGNPGKRGCQNSKERGCENPGEGDCQNTGAGMVQRQAQGQLEKERQQLCNFREAYQRRIREHGHTLKRSYGETKVNQRLEQAQGTSSQESDTAGCKQREARPCQRGRPAARGRRKRPRRRCTVVLSDAQTQTDKLGRGCSPGRSSSCLDLPSTSGQACRPKPGPSPARRKGSSCNSSQSSAESGGRASSVEGEEEEDEEEETRSSSSSQCSTPSSVSCSEEQAPAIHKQAGGLCTATELVLARPPDKAVAIAGPAYPPRGDRRKLSSAVTGHSLAYTEQPRRRRTPIPASHPQRSQDNWGCLIF